VLRNCVDLTKTLKILEKIIMTVSKHTKIVFTCSITILQMITETKKKLRKYSLAAQKRGCMKLEIVG
jgi:hypothetical protein